MNEEAANALSNPTNADDADYYDGKSDKFAHVINERENCAVIAMRPIRRVPFYRESQFVLFGTLQP